MQADKIIEVLRSDVLGFLQDGNDLFGAGRFFARAHAGALKRRAGAFASRQESASARALAWGAPLRSLGCEFCPQRGR